MNNTNIIKWAVTPPFLKENIKKTSVIVVTVFFLRKMNLVQIKEATYLLPIFITAENTVVRLLELDTSLIFITSA